MVFLEDQFLIKSIMIRLSAHDPLNKFGVSVTISVLLIITIENTLFFPIEMTKANRRPNL